MDGFGARRTVSADTLRALLGAMGCAVAGARQIAVSLATAERRPVPKPERSPGPERSPERCFGLDDLGQERLWGVAVQLYGLRSAANWGRGTFGDLGRLAGIAGTAGAALIGINPLHALSPADPDQCSPYSPSDRRFLDPLYIEVEAVPDFAECRAARAMVEERRFGERLAAARAAPLVDHGAVARLQRPVLECLHTWFRRHHLEQGTERGLAFRAFVAERGEALRRHALFEALHAAAGPGRGWRAWPARHRDPDSPEVAHFAARHEVSIELFQYLQWEADRQLAEAQRAARAAGMAIGLYRDLAVAVHPEGARSWAEPGVVVTGATVGAPPDRFNAQGQNWNLAPFAPQALAERAFAPFADDLRHNMRHAGALRIDHVMGLARLFWIPEGATPAQGAYVRYPLADLLATVARESRRQRCLVIGEDLGTVAPGFRRRMTAAGLLSYRVLQFERTGDGGFRTPANYPRDALVTASTHDLPTLAGFWVGRDLAWCEWLGLPAAVGAEAASEARRQDCQQLLAALARAGVLPSSLSPDSPLATAGDALILAIHRFLAATPGRLMMVQLEDVLAELEQANLPGTTTGHPNWRRRLGRALGDEALAARLAALGEMMAAAGRGMPTGGGLPARR